LRGSSGNQFDFGKEWTMDEKKKVELNIEELEERIAPTTPDVITVTSGDGVIFNQGRGDGTPPPSVYVNGEQVI
jgi:hypothetical protein